MKNQNKMRSKTTGKETEYLYADKLLAAAFEYFTWCEDNPWMKKELLRSGERKGEMTEIPVTRPYTLAGLYVYCDISEATFNSYFESEEMKGAAQHISDIIRQNHLEGALIGVYNSTLVSRLMEVNSSLLSESGKNDVPFVVRVIDNETKEELEEFRNSL